MGETKEIVLEIYLYIYQFHGDLNPQVFMGHDKMRPEKRENVLAAFKSYQNPVLIATQAVEEECRIGDVDFVICFDTFDPTPARFIQRRKFAQRSNIGHMTFLLTEYGETQTLAKMYAEMVTLFDKIRGTFILKSEIRPLPVEKGREKKQLAKLERRPCKRWYLQPLSGDTVMETENVPGAQSMDSGFQQTQESSLLPTHDADERNDDNVGSFIADKNDRKYFNKRSAKDGGQTAKKLRYSWETGESSSPSKVIMYFRRS